MIYKTFSKSQIARIFNVDRLTVYGWERHCFPFRPPERPGRPARIDFESALEWFLAREADRGVSDEGLQLLEKVIRERKEKCYGRKS